MGNTKSKPELVDALDAAVYDACTAIVKKRPGGRPRKSLSDQEVYRVAAMIARGSRREDVARELGITAPTLRRMEREDERVASAIQAGLGVEHQRLYGKLMEKVDRGDTVAILFALKSRHGYIDRPENVRIEDHRSVVVNLPARLSREQILAAVLPQPALEAEVVSRG